jgi:hypothetical protein
MVCTHVKHCSYEYVSIIQPPSVGEKPLQFVDVEHFRDVKERGREFGRPRRQQQPFFVPAYSAVGLAPDVRSFKRVLLRQPVPRVARATSCDVTRYASISARASSSTLSLCGRSRSSIFDLRSDGELLLVQGDRINYRLKFGE